MTVAAVAARGICSHGPVVVFFGARSRAKSTGHTPVAATF